MTQIKLNAAARIQEVKAATEMVRALGKLLISKLNFGKATIRRTGELDMATVKFETPPTEAKFVKAMEKLKAKKTKGSYRVLFPEEDNLQLLVKRLEDGSLSIDAN